MKRTILLLLVTVSLAHGQDAATRSRHYNLEKQVALDGYDPVSYFQGKPLEGKPENKVTYLGITYLFANPNNVTQFKANPQKYEPAYGGWCAYAMGESGEKVKVDPETYKIVDGQLYLFYNFWGNNTLRDWNANERPLKAKADQNWKKFVQ